MTLPVQPFPWEAILAALFLLLAVLAVRGVRRRRAFASLTSDTPLPHLETQQRVRGTIRRVFRDPSQGVWQVVAEIGTMRLTFCATDHAQAADRYQSLLGKPADLALLALATLAPGGIDTMKHQIKDADKMDLRPDMVLLTPAGQFANDYAVVGLVHDVRDDTWDEMPLRVYRAEVVRKPDLTLVLDLAVPAGDAEPFAPRSLVHGSARLFGYLA